MSINRSPSPSLNNDEYCLASNIPFKLNVPLDPLVGLQKHVEEYTKLSNESSSSLKGYSTGDGYLSLERGIIEKMEISLKEQRDFEEGIGSLLEDNEAITKLSRQTYRWMNKSSSATKSIFDSSANNGGGSGGGAYNTNSNNNNNNSASSKVNSYGQSTISKSNYSSSTQPTNYSTQARNPPITSTSTAGNAPRYSAYSSTNTMNATATSVTTAPPKPETPESKALQLAQTYIPHETKERQDSFTRIYLAINQQQQYTLTAPLTDFEILQAFIKFDSNENSSIMYLKNMQALKEMGFPSEQIQQTLQHHPFDQEKALEEIFSKM